MVIIVILDANVLLSKFLDIIILLDVVGRRFSHIAVYLANFLVIC